MYLPEESPPQLFRECIAEFELGLGLINDLQHSSGVRVLKTDYTVESLTSLLSSSHIDAVVSNLNGQALGAPQIALIDAAKAAGVKRFLPSEYGSDTTNPTVLEWVELLKGKKKIVDYLKTKEGGGFEWTSLITGAFLDWVCYLTVLLHIVLASHC